jgi:hypothetical protein
MPGYDGTGPRGQGPLTGGGRGYCVTGWGGGVRRGFGLRRWPRRGYYGYGAGWRWDDAPMPAETATDDFADVGGLAEQIRVLTSRVEELSARLEAQERSAG